MDFNQILLNKKAEYLSWVAHCGQSLLSMIALLSVRAQTEIFIFYLLNTLRL